MKWIFWILLGLLHPGFDANDDMKPANYTDALAILADRNQPEDRMLRIGTLAGWGNTAQALSELNDLTGTTDEIVAYKGYMTAVLASGSDLMNMPDANYATAKGYTDEVNTSALAMSQGLAHLREGVYHPLVPIASGGGGDRSSEDSLLPSQTSKETGVVVSPNPFVTSISFDFRNLADDTRIIEATDLSGRMVWKNTATGNGKVVWDTSSLPSGLYFYRVCSSLGDELAVGKIVKITQ